MLAAGVSSAAHATDVYDDAVAHPGRLANDLKRDPIDKPAEMLRLAGIKPGMQVADFLAASGYYSELLSYVVGPRGHVLLLNNAAYDKFANNAWKDAHREASPCERRAPHGRLGEHGPRRATRSTPVVMMKVYHDLYWVSAEDGWPKIDVGSVLDQIAQGVEAGRRRARRRSFGEARHRQLGGAGSASHRRGVTRARISSRMASKLVAKSDLLRRPDDARDEITYKGPMVGKTDRFVFVFQKPCAK